MFAAQRNAGRLPSAPLPAPGPVASLALRLAPGWPATRKASAAPLLVQPCGHHPTETAAAIVHSGRGFASSTDVADFAGQRAVRYCASASALSPAVVQPPRQPEAGVAPTAAALGGPGSHWPPGNARHGIAEALAPGQRAPPRGCSDCRH